MARRRCLGRRRHLVVFRAATKLSRLIDLSKLGWQPLRVSAAGLEIARTCTIAQLNGVTAPVEWTAAPLIDQCCRAFLASFKIWNMATVAAICALSLPAGPMISLTTALDGVCTVWTADGGERQVAVIDFVKGPLSNDLKPGELLRRIDIPASALMKRTAFRQVSLARLGRSAALLIGTLAPDGAFALTVTASTPRPVKLSFPALPSVEDLLARIEREIPAAGWFDDIHGLPAWRRHMTLHFAQEILGEFAGTPR